MIEFVCPHCGNLLKVAEAMAGQNGKCNKCNSAITVPEGGGASTSFDSLVDEPPEAEEPEAPVQMAEDQAAPTDTPDATGPEPVGMGDDGPVEAASFGAYGKAGDAGWVDPTEQVRPDGADAELPEIPIHVLRRKAKNERRKKIRSIVTACIAALLGIYLLIYFLSEKPRPTLPDLPAAPDEIHTNR
jgi:ribosomal protein S27E